MTYIKLLEPEHLLTVNVRPVVMKLYLAHPILDRDWVRQAELRMESEIEIEFDNPFYDGRERGDIKAIDAGTTQPYDVTLDYADIAKGDLEAIDYCDGLVAIVTTSPSIGTYMEIFYNSYVLKRPTYLIIMNEEFATHPWLRFCATNIFPTIETFENFLLMNGVKKK